MNNLDPSKGDVGMKVVFLGNASVGKTSIIERYIEETFKETTQSTLGAMFFSKTLKYQGANYKLQIWDTAGQERFKSITPIYYKDAQGVILVCDISDPKNAISSIKDWYYEVNQNISKDTAYSVIIVGNKIDKLTESELAEKKEDISRLAQEMKCSYL